MRNTKIICTIGPVSENEETLRKLINAGLDAVRLNFTHGDHNEHGRRIELVKKLSKELNKHIAIILDTSSSELRLGDFKSDNVEIVKDQQFIITTRKVEGDNRICSVSYEKLHQFVKSGDMILIDDGNIVLKVQEVEGQDIKCKVLNNGYLCSKKGICIPNINLGLPVLTSKDIEDIKFGIEKGVDMIAASFISKPSDVLQVRRVLEMYGGKGIKVIAKIENQQGIDNIDEILELADGVMVARGDLGVEIPIEDVPVVQKMIIEKANKSGKTVITATQMLESMINNPRPTRAEVTDIANAIFDGTDAIMLSGETSKGNYPIEAVETMARVAERTEKALDYELILENKYSKKFNTVPDAICYAAVKVANELNASAIISATQSGYTAKMVSKYRPKCPIIATTPYEDVARSLAIVRGAYPIVIEKVESIDQVIKLSVKAALDKGIVSKGDLVVIVSGVPVDFSGTTNMMKITKIGDEIV